MLGLYSALIVLYCDSGYRFHFLTLQRKLIIFFLLQLHFSDILRNKPEKWR